MILIYHNIVADRPGVEGKYQRLGLPMRCFVQQLDWLRRNRQIVSLSDYLKLREQAGPSYRHAVAITFDDGLASTFARVYPLLQAWAIPATFFISTYHLSPGRLLWFSYLNALCFERIYAKVSVSGRSFPLSSPAQRELARRSLGAMARSSNSPKAFCDKLSATYPVPTLVAAEYQGMSPKQLRLLGESDLLESGAHTVNHPFLDQLSQDEQEEEIVSSRQQVARLTGKRVRYFAYPNGDYNRDTLKLLKGAGFDAAFATHQKRVGINDRFEIVRLGIYSISFFKFWLKAQGVASVAQRFHLASP